MKTIKLIFTFILITLAVSIINAQDGPPPNDFIDRNDPPQNEIRLVTTLGLNNEQIKQIRLINQQRRPQMQKALKNLRIAKDELDEVIYSDMVDETTIQTKLRAVVVAQGEITKIRTMSEFAVRSVLTPEQLVKFRELRNRIKEQRELRKENALRPKNNRRQRTPLRRNQQNRP